MKIQALFIVIYLSTASVLVSYAQPPVQWLRCYEYEGEGGFFYDVVWTGNHNSPGYAMCGWNSHNVPNHWEWGSSMHWLVATDRDGDPVVNRGYYDVRQCGFMAEDRSLISCDDGGFLLGGRSGWVDTVNFQDGETYFTMIKTDSTGEVEWFRYYGGNSALIGCNAVIELKNGQFVGAGNSKLNGSLSAYAVMVEPNGDILWERFYENTITFTAIREAPDGLLFSGKRHDESTLVKTDFDGEVDWAAEWNGYFRGLVSCPAGGFAICGSRNLMDEQGNRQNDILLIRVNDEGDELWSQTYDVCEGNESGEALVSMPDHGFLIVGYTGLHVNPIRGVMVRTDSQGNRMWSRDDDSLRFANDVVDIHDYRSVILNGDSLPVIAGLCYFEHQPKGMLLQLADDREAPRILAHFPVSLDTTVVRGDTTTFWVSAVDPQRDQVRYLWTGGEDTLGTDSSVAVTFEEDGQFTINCFVSDGEHADSISWSVDVVGLVITRWQPESVAIRIRRGTELSFSLAARAAHDLGELHYAWKMEDSLLVERDSLQIRFDRVDEYSICAIASAGELSDSLNWVITVTGVISTWWPEEFTLSLPKSTSQSFFIYPSSPESDSLSYSWLLDGNEIGSDSSLTFQFSDTGSFVLTAFVFDGSESDTLSWNIAIYDPNSVSSNSQSPTAFCLYPPRPNPFNATTTLSYSLIKSGRASLRLYDLRGCLVTTLLDEYQTAGQHQITFDARFLPAGMYLIRLQSGDQTLVRKVIVMK